MKIHVDIYNSAGIKKAATLKVAAFLHQLFSTFSLPS